MQPLKLFFDECCSKRLPGKIIEVYKEDYDHIQTKHLTQMMQAGTDDAVWLELLHKEKDWIVITTDRGKDPKKPKLPIICTKLGITHVSITPSLIEEGYTAQKQALLTVWPSLLRLPSILRGTRVSLGYRMYNKGLTKGPYLSVDTVQFDVWCKENGIGDHAIKEPAGPVFKLESPKLGS
jgi:hypothetical protein